jgi:nitrogen fixation protein NifB
MNSDLSTHPCFNDSTRHSHGRIHLPVAPDCNIQCNFCNRQYDCLNESRPGVSSVVLSPGQALYYLERVLAWSPNIVVVGLAGPGDPFANAEATIETLRLVRERYPRLLLCLASNGLGIRPHVDTLARLKVSHVTITVNAVEPEIGQKIYAWVRDGRQVLRGLIAARTLLARQLVAIRALKSRGITVKVNTIVIPGVNDRHVADVARVVARAGASIQNCLELYHLAGTPFASLTELAPGRLELIRADAGRFIPQMAHCTRCRADAAGLIGDKMSQTILACLREADQQPLNPQENRPYVAVGSYEGILVNRHLGEAEQLWIFGREGGDLKLIGARPTPPPGGGDRRWIELADILKDCRAVLVGGVGQAPRAILQRAGIRTVVMEGLIEDAVAAIDRGETIQAPPTAQGCAGGCNGTPDAGNGHGKRTHSDHQKPGCGCGAGTTCGGDGLGCG